MNIVVAMLVADFLRAEVAAGRSRVLELDSEMRCIRRQAFRKYGFLGTKRLNRSCYAEFDAHDAKEKESRDVIECTVENNATLATLMVAIQHDNVDYLIAQGKKFAMFDTFYDAGLTRK